DGRRDRSVTGVQTCALPICTRGGEPPVADGRYTRRGRLFHDLAAVVCEGREDAGGASEIGSGLGVGIHLEVLPRPVTFVRSHHYSERGHLRPPREQLRGADVVFENRVDGGVAADVGVDEDRKSTR